MDLISISTYPVGTKTTVLVSIDQCVDDHLMGTEIPFGTPIAFPNVGEIGEGLMTLYNVKRSDEKLHDAWILTPDPGYPPKDIGHQFPRTLVSFMMFAVDWVDFLLPWTSCTRLVVFLVRLCPPLTSVLWPCLRLV